MCVHVRLCEPVRVHPCMAGRHIGWINSRCRHTYTAGSIYAVVCMHGACRRADRSLSVWCIEKDVACLLVLVGLVPAMARHPHDVAHIRQTARNQGCSKQNNAYHPPPPTPHAHPYLFVYFRRYLATIVRLSTSLCRMPQTSSVYVSGPGKEVTECHHGAA